MQYNTSSAAELEGVVYETSTEVTDTCIVTIEGWNLGISHGAVEHNAMLSLLNNITPNEIMYEQFSN